MKEIDFLPSWYVNGRRRQMSYKTQYAAILCILFAMAGWNFYTARSVSNAQASIGFSSDQREQLTGQVQQYGEIRSAITKLSSQASTITKLDSRIYVDSVLAELSFLVDSKIVITDLKIEAMPFEQPQDNTNPAAVRIANDALRGNAGTMQGPARCAIVLRGMAGEAGDVARLICRLEESPYFMEVIPEFTRTKELGGRQVSEFELSMNLENFHRDKQVK